MKKMILASIFIIVTVGVVFSLKEVRGKSFEKETSFAVDSVEEIEVNNENWNVEFKKAESKKVTIAAEGKQKDKKKDPVTVKNDGKKIIVNQQDQKGRFIDGFSFGKKGTIYISIPKNEVDTITLHNRSGDIKMNDVTTKNIVLSNVSGSEKIEGLSAEKGTFTSQAGELSVKDSSLKELSVSSTTGDNYITNVTTPKMKVTSTDGEVSIKDIKEGKLLLVETKLGDIGVSYKEAPTSLMLTANSNSSDITVNLNGLKKKTNTEKSKEGTIGDASNKVELLSKKGTININS
ncbi:hypothetical protein CON65_24875 [Bacillus pseudomycoides]|uniref:DUF4097 domain-containing protein n=1 Tax=Bacillus pseudomycoides TaxID=64104 RepID=A0AA91ZQX1_9BACI|nr:MULTISPECIES: DUF4097 family beta strand repeat-containing protein [Bacillus]PEB51293.1 hypothetical protein COO03_17270 [Bacillus sp. AFS098217]PED80051.1 hypothetical protein CON65_24875 [Bacillus pseudomycoides]PEU07004.1 hypothetical protein CN524_21950 [Bacillus sp. AFS019443]PEU20952.1 hypothetical protein CN525_03360 [Bacillus sp. AFS014408]PFW58779.1 hypothetical protein COL20_25060 [Bacillus sp. AFS075034]